MVLKSIKIICLLMTFIITFSLTVYAVTDENNHIIFPDQDLENALISEGVDSNLDGKISRDEALAITKLILDNRSISDLSGLEYFTNLTYLTLYHNDISELTPLKGMVQLEGLFLPYNNISDLRDLKGLSNLSQLGIGFNNISNLNPLRGLTNLTYLSIEDANVSNINALSGMTQLDHLTLNMNNISDIKALKGLTNISYLNLGDNAISDISALSGMNKLGKVYLYDNNINDISSLTGKTDIWYLAMHDNNIKDISPLLGNTFNYLSLGGNPLYDYGIFLGTIYFGQYSVWVMPEGFVTGGGWINSPVGAYIDRPDLSGKGCFSFSTKYEEEQLTPMGVSSFEFMMGDFAFTSDTYEELGLVVEGDRAEIRGTGSVNGSLGYSFMITAIDGDYEGLDEEDLFRIKIWDTTTESVLYDNKMGLDDSSDISGDSTILGGGNIVIHK